MITNWYAGPDQREQWTACGLLSTEEYEGARLIYRRDRDFFHLYHVAESLDALARALAQVGGTLTADLVGRPEDWRRWLPCIARMDFAIT